MGELFLDDNEINLMVIGESQFQKTIMQEHGLPEKWVCHVPARPMKMIDRIWYNFDDGTGKYGKGYLKAEKNISHEEWSFYCHFYGDPVIPGTIGLDGCYQCLGITMLIKGMPGVARALAGTFEYTGQVLTNVKKTAYRMDIKRIICKPSPLLIADVDYYKNDDQAPIYKLTDARMGFFREGELERSSSYLPNWSKIKETALQEIEDSKQYYLKHFGREGF